MKKSDSPHIVPSRSPVLRKKGTALFLSLAAPGLGEIYATAWSRGIAMFLARFLIFIVTAYAAATKPGELPLYYAAMLLGVPAVTLISMKSAWTLAGKKAILGRMNSLLIYLVFLLGSLAAAGAGIAVVSGLAMPVVAGSDKSLPSVDRNEIIIVSPSRPGLPERGELVILANGTILRIIGLPGEKITFTGEQLLIDRYPLAHEVIAEELLQWRYPEHTRELIAEENHGVRYPVLPGKGPETVVTVPEKKFLGIPDDRRGGYAVEPLDTGEIRGQVRGILFSTVWYRNLLSPRIR